MQYRLCPYPLRHPLIRHIDLYRRGLDQKLPGGRLFTHKWKTDKLNISVPYVLLRNKMNSQAQVYFVNFPALPILATFFFGLLLQHQFGFHQYNTILKYI